MIDEKGLGAVEPAAVCVLGSCLPAERKLSRKLSRSRTVCPSWKMEIYESKYTKFGVQGHHTTILSCRNSEQNITQKSFSPDRRGYVKFIFLLDWKQFNRR